MFHFHARTLALLNVTPGVSLDALSELDGVEARIGRRVPASVREWYALDGACQLLRQYSNDDWPVKISELGLPQNNAHGEGPNDLLTRDLVVFRYENQAVCVWAFRVDGSDDPPVHVHVESRFKAWTQCSPTFSEHLYAWMWDYALVLNRELLIQAQNRRLTGTAISFLNDNFEVGPTTYGWPGQTQHRYAKGDKRILIWASEDQADWWVSADRDESLLNLISEVWECDQVGESMWSNSERAASLL